jgi:hypothetical protein
MTAVIRVTTPTSRVSTLFQRSVFESTSNIRSSPPVCRMA